MRVSLVLACVMLTGLCRAQIELDLVGRYDSGIQDQSAAEIVAYDQASAKLFVTNAAANAIDVLDLSDPEQPAKLFAIDLNPYGAGVNSVAVSGGLVVAAVEADPKQAPGTLVFFDLNGNPIQSVQAGALPDMVTFTPDGRRVLAANEGEPSQDYTVDPAGSITIVDISEDWSDPEPWTVRVAGFERFDREGVPVGVRVFGPGASPSRDLEPEYITVSEDSSTAYVSCQENNAIAVVDIDAARVVSLLPLGLKDHSEPGNGFDASDRDNEARIRAWPVFGMYQPDSIARFHDNGSTYVVTANEGDAREYAGFIETSRVGDLELDTGTFPDAAELVRDENLGRLNVSLEGADHDGDGDIDQFNSFGARSVSIWRVDDGAELVWDSGDQIETQSFAALGGRYDERSDAKGPEPEAITVGAVGGRRLIFSGLERTNAIIVFDSNDLSNVSFAAFEPLSPRDIAPESLLLISAEDSPDSTPLLVCANEVSGSVAIYRVTITPTDE